MSVLPIVARELRGASRRRGTYRVRTVVAGVAVLTGGFIFLATFGTPAAQSGRTIFQGLSVLLLFYCLAAGRVLTVDCLSVEKREGTLGLLFLTDLKGYDVVLGKLAATSLNGLYALLAVMPVLALSMLLGAVANAEFWRMVLTLAVTFFFSLAIGIFCSALSRDARRASAGNFALLLLFVGVLPAMVPIIDYFHPGHPIVQAWFYTCPGYAFFLSFDVPYKTGAGYFWSSIVVIHALTWLLIFLASWIVPYTWQDKTARAGKPGWRDLWHAWNYGPAAGRAPFRKRLLDVNAFYWLAGRARFKPLHVWTCLALLACWWTWSLLRARDVWWSDVVVIVSALILNSTLKFWITLEAGQQLAEDQRMGTLELLLPTPLTARDILDGQWLALRRQFLRPLLAVIAAELILATVTVRHQMGVDDKQLVFMVAGGVVVLLADCYALAWVSMRLALTSRSASRAAIGTVTRILILPWVGYGAIQLVISIWSILWPEKAWEPQWRFNLGLWFGLGIFTDLLFGLTARHQLLVGFRRLAMHRFESQPSRLARWLASPAAAGPLPGTGSFSTTMESRPVRWNRRKRIAVALGIVLVLLVPGVLLLQRKQEFKYPPPLVILIAQSNTPLFVNAGQESMFVLPDGSLWRWGISQNTEQPEHDLPEQIGRSHNWVQVDGSYHANIGLQRDGTVWAWDSMRGATGAGQTQLEGEPFQLGQSHDWAGVASGNTRLLALKKDGSLWTWGNIGPNQSGTFPGPNQTNAVQVGTDHDWAAIRASGSFNVAVRTNGTLWTWGQTILVSNGATRFSQVVSPTQAYRETNWAGLEKGYGYLAWTTSGALWQLFIRPPNAETSITSGGRLILTNSRPGHFAIAARYTSQIQLLHFFQVHDDGTLWECDSPPASVLPGTWHRVGARSDWISIWGGGGTAFGLTRDGTIWTWGIDWSRKMEIPFSARLQMLQEQVGRLIKPAGPGSGGIGPLPTYQELPRPLMRMVMTGANQTGESTNLGNSKSDGH